MLLQDMTEILVIQKSLTNNIYPYKTAKHAFPDGFDITCSYSLAELNEGVK